MTDFKKNLKALVLLLGLAVAMPFSAQAQITKSMYHEGSLMDDPTAKWQSQGLMQRQGLMNDRTSTSAWTITNNGIGQDETPLGSGLLILGAAGAGYAIAKRRKNNKKNVALILAALMLLGFTQCKKEDPIAQDEPEGIYITLTTDGGNNGSRVDVNPTGGSGFATVDFEENDVIYVGHNGAYCGFLKHNGTNFSGTITPTGADNTDYLHFYFMGNKGEESEPTSVSISDQTSKYPVISYGRSTVLFNSGTSAYSTTLYNKCAIVKFTTTDIAADITITGMKNTVAVDFSKNKGTGDVVNPFTYTKTGDGDITLHKVSNTERWAILLPQDEVTTATATATGYASEGTFTVPEITANMYSNTGVNISMTAVWDGDLSKITSETTEAFATATDGMTIYGTLGVGVNKKISIADGATVTLNNATINGTNNSSCKWAGITCLGDATIILSGTNTVKGFYENYPGIQAAVGKTLTINGTGSLTASSNGYGVGIGGGYNIACGNIEIQGGTITATGGNQAAGIGSGFQGTCGNITISGGTVTATGGHNGGAGIGSGYEGTCGNITITRGVTQVTATMGAGATNSIGAGFTGTCGTVTIGGVVTGPITTSPYTYYPGPLTYPIALSAATSDYVGSVITTDGYVYATVDAADAASKTAVAIIAYVGTAGSVDASSGTYKGLAIALSDANSGSKCQWAEKNDGYENCLNGIGGQTGAIATALGFMNGITCTSTLTAAGHSSHNHTAATAAVSNNSTAAPTGTSGWFMPSMGQWNLIVQGLATKKAGSAVTTDLTYQTDNPTYKANNLNSVITDAGGTGFQAGSYWASTEQTHVRAWVIYFTGGYAFNYAKDATWYVRSVIAF